MSNYREFNVYNISKFCFNYFFWFYWICIGWGICDYDVIFFQSDVIVDVIDYVWNVKNYVVCVVFLFYDFIYFELEFDIIVVFDFFFWNEIINWICSIKFF